MSQPNEQWWRLAIASEWDGGNIPLSELEAVRLVKLASSWAMVPVPNMELLPSVVGRVIGQEACDGEATNKIIRFFRPPDPFLLAHEMAHYICLRGQYDYDHGAYWIEIHFRLLGVLWPLRDYARAARASVGLADLTQRDVE